MYAAAAAALSRPSNKEQTPWHNSRLTPSPERSLRAGITSTGLAPIASWPLAPATLLGALPTMGHNKGTWCSVTVDAMQLCKMDCCIVATAVCRLHEGYPYLCNMGAALTVSCYNISRVELRNCLSAQELLILVGIAVSHIRPNTISTIFPPWT